MEKRKRDSGSGIVYVHSLKELLIMQRKGKFLRPHEKKSIEQYAREQRIKNLKKKTSR